MGKKTEFVLQAILVIALVLMAGVAFGGCSTKPKLMQNCQYTTVENLYICSNF